MTLFEKCVSAFNEDFDRDADSNETAIRIVFNQIANADNETILAIIKAEDLYCRLHPSATDQEAMRAALKVVFGRFE